MKKIINFLKYISCLALVIIIFGIVATYLVSLNFESGKKNKIGCLQDNENIEFIFEKDKYNIQNIEVDCNTYNVEISSDISYTKSQIVSLMLNSARMKKDMGLMANIEVLFDGYFIRILDGEISMVP